MFVCSEPFEVGFVDTLYTVFEDAGSAEVCVTLLVPQTDINEEYAVVGVYDDSSSIYIPEDAVLASEQIILTKYLVEY